MDKSFPLTLTLSPAGRGDAWGGRGAMRLALRPRLAADASGGDIFRQMKSGAGSCG
jgi:hypothetical protein